MRKALGIPAFATLIAIAFFIAGISFDRYYSEHPRVTVKASLDNPDDAVTAIRNCAKSASWNVTLKTGEPLTLELLSCSGDFHPKALGEPDDEGWPWPINRQVLLLEQRDRWHVKVVSALYADLNFMRVEPGRPNGSNTDVVLWSYSIKCGSCHGGPEGILIWDETNKQYNWNKSWLDGRPQVSAIRAALPDGYYLDEANSFSGQAVRPYT